MTGPDVAPYRDRQIVVLPPDEGMRWLDPQVPARGMLRTLPAGSLDIHRVG